MQLLFIACGGFVDGYNLSFNSELIIYFLGIVHFVGHSSFAKSHKKICCECPKFIAVVSLISVFELNIDKKKTFRLKLIVLIKITDFFRSSTCVACAMSLPLCLCLSGLDKPYIFFVTKNIGQNKKTYLPIYLTFLFLHFRFAQTVPISLSDSAQISRRVLFAFQ